MKIFLDTADTDAIASYSSLGIIDGITTNPTNLAAQKGDPLERIKKICALLPYGDINVEITQDDPSLAYKQAVAIAKIAKNIVVKIPCHQKYYPMIAQLVSEGIAINITLLFSLIQGLYMCKLGVRYISPFIGRLDDIGQDGLELIYNLRAMIDQYGYDTQILAASIRSDRQLHEVILAGADVATVSPKIFEKSLQHPLTDQGMEQFLKDWQKIGVKQFP